MDGIIFDYKHFSVNDGPGIRLTVFLKGCPLKCLWCHNPEGIKCEIESYKQTDQLDGMFFERQVVVGKKVSVSDVMDTILADRVFFEKSGGGVTFSGGEPLLQYSFLLEVLKACRHNKIHTIVDTSGYADFDVFREIADNTDMFLFDLKTIEPKLHYKYTKVDNKNILQNLGYTQVSNTPVRIRIPLVQGYTDNLSNIIAIKNIVKNMKNIIGVDILPFHPSGLSKYERMNKNYDLSNLKTYPANKSNFIADIFKDMKLNVTIGG